MATTARVSSTARESAWEFCWNQLERETDLFSILCPYQHKQSPHLRGGHDGREKTGPHLGRLQDGCWRLLGPINPSARWFWSPPSPDVLSLCSQPCFQWVPTWVVMGSGWVGTQWAHPRETPVLPEPVWDFFWLVHPTCARSVSRPPPGDTVASRGRYINNHKKS